MLLRKILEQFVKQKRTTIGYSPSLWCIRNCARWIPEPGCQFSVPIICAGVVDCLFVIYLDAFVMDEDSKMHRQWHFQFICVWEIRAVFRTRYWRRNVLLCHFLWINMGRSTKTHALYVSELNVISLISWQLFKNVIYVTSDLE